MSRMQILAPAGASASADNNEKNEEAAPVPITEDEVVGYREQDRFLPINNIQRLMKRSLPESSKISKDAKECIQECTSEFISFITSEASDKATAEKRKTITGDDVLNALKSLGFEDLSDVLFIYLARYRTLQRNEPSRKRQRKGKKDTNGQSTSTSTNGHAVENEEEDDEEENEEEQNGIADKDVNVKPAAASAK